MAGSLAAGSGGSGGGARRRRRHKAPIADINMTPFIDVMLCLLIIFMVAAPLLTSGVTLDLPQSAAGALNVDKKPLTVSIKADGQVYINDSETPETDLLGHLQAIAGQGAGTDERIFVRGDKAANYGAIMQVMGRISGAGYKKVALITDQDNQ
ncbi:ExbD/TolR family protein [Labrys monachus]|uniref:Biopolymer transport protein TolR n=1 Tax=Labrys monachus TaxID=217067 RepID=A0ABU0F8S7_9HYPH|nr:ExbD/TolR family protein [Labrys monachus]MDQ0390841.1 biopolymer transport protein TolR [Labrys monachus]